MDMDWMYEAIRGDIEPAQDMMRRKIEEDPDEPVPDHYKVITETPGLAEELDKHMFAIYISGLAMQLDQGAALAESAAFLTAWAFKVGRQYGQIEGAVSNGMPDD